MIKRKKNRPENLVSLIFILTGKLQNYENICVISKKAEVMSAERAKLTIILHSFRVLQVVWVRNLRVHRGLFITDSFRASAEFVVFEP
jgi:hypothetical protein